MKKIKELWVKNKILWVFLLVLVICLIAILIVCFTFFFGGTSSVYGDRLDKIEDYPVTEVFKTDYQTQLEEDEMIESVNIRTKGRIIYISMTFVGNTTLVEAQSKAVASLELIGEDLLSYYDINFTLKCVETEESEGFTLMGARNVNGTGVVWNNNTPFETEESED